MADWEANELGGLEGCEVVVGMVEETFNQVGHFPPCCLLPSYFDEVLPGVYASLASVS